VAALNRAGNDAPHDESNGHMIGINETLGYRVIGPPERSWELPATQVLGPAQS
jgi:hypothetical protein